MPHPFRIAVLGDYIWGCDFRPRERDFGDQDLREAIE
jgi:hypothetical protein